MTTMVTSFDKIRGALEAHGERFTDVRQNHFKATCPAHEDKHPSLGVDYKGDRIMVRCYTGCQTDDVMLSLGLELRDLFDEDPGEGRGDPKRAIPVRSYVYETRAGAPWIIKDRYFPKTFLQRLPGTEPGDRAGLRGRQPVLYHLPRLAREIAKDYCTVWLVDGEKDVEALEGRGQVATCAPGGSGARWHPEFSDFLKDASEVIIVADQDMEKPDGSLGSGQQYAIEARAGIRSVGVPCRIVAPKGGKDVSDHFNLGFGLDDFLPEPTAFVRPRGMKADVLMTTEFEPLKWAVPGLVCAGLTICAGSPKCGKSWLWYDVALAVGIGGTAWGGELPANQGSVLYLAREDSYRRLQSRLSFLMADTMDAPAALEVIPADQEWAGGELGLANMTEWADECGNPLLVVIDTLGRVEPNLGESRERGAYSGNYSMMTRYKQWADQFNCAVVMVHHDNKMRLEEGVDPFQKISGTQGLTGAADTLMYLETTRGVPGGTLHVTGRDVLDQSLELKKSGAAWQLTERVETY